MNNSFRTFLISLLLVGSWAAWSSSADAKTGRSENLFGNGGFEQGLDEWNYPWARDGEITADSDESEKQQGKQSVRIEHTGTRDWNFARTQRMDVTPGEIFRLTGWIRVQGEGTVKPCMLLYDQKYQMMRWDYAGTPLKADEDWQPVDFRFAIPNGCREMWFRLSGRGAATVLVDDMSLTREGNLNPETSAEPLEIENDLVRLEFSAETGTCSLHDKRTGKTWQQSKQVSTGKSEVFVTVLNAKRTASRIKAELIEPETMFEFSAVWRLAEDAAEVSVELDGDGPMNINLGYPYPFVSSTERTRDWLVLPLNEGIAYPIDDETLEPTWYNLYSGHGLCMSWYGVADLAVGGTGDGLMTIIETPNDAAVHSVRKEGRLCLAPKWAPEKEAFGPKRMLRYVLIDQGGYVAMCKRYRTHAKKTGLFKTLAEKRQENPNVDLLVGAANVWFRDHKPGDSADPVAQCKEMQSLGIDRIQWSMKSTAEEIRQMNELGVLTGRYDLYQDCMNPANYPKLRAVFSDVWTSDRWPDGIIIKKDGDWARGWEMPGKKKGEIYACGRLCDRFAPDYARTRVAEELKTHPYRGRFIDTTTAMPWVECYSTNHPMTRTESRQFRMELLDVMSREFKQVTGSETGHEAAVPHLHYFEGMMSLGPYRVPDAGRYMIRPWHDVPERVAKFQTGHKYRIPLWELVYHECVVAQWYWGDYNNKLPSLWDRRDLFNLLYNTPPMFMFNREIWEANRDRFVQSYETTHQLPRETGYAEMLSHRWLTDDHAVQQTRFSNGTSVTVNFGDMAYTTEAGRRIKPLGYMVEK